MTKIEEKVWKLVLAEVALGLGENKPGIENLNESQLKTVRNAMFKSIQDKQDHLEEMRKALQSLKDDERIPR
jgi:hypothetical protein